MICISCASLHVMPGKRERKRVEREEKRGEEEGKKERKRKGKKRETRTLYKVNCMCRNRVDGGRFKF